MDQGEKERSYHLEENFIQYFECHKGVTSKPVSELSGNYSETD